MRYTQALEVAMSRAVKAKRKPKQLDLPMPTWGGKRAGAGRKPKGLRALVRHVPRPRVHRDHPVHVTLRIRDGLPSLRSRGAWAVIVGVLRRARGRFGAFVTDFSVMGNHLHLLVESEGRESLSRAMRGLVARLVKRLNAHFGRTGKLFADRYHARVLSTPLEIRRALAYVLLNYRKHAAATGRRLAPKWLDPRSSAAKFTGWKQRVQSVHAVKDFGTAAPRTWLRRVGWKRHGLLAVDEVPTSLGRAA